MYKKVKEWIDYLNAGALVTSSKADKRQVLYATKAVCKGAWGAIKQRPVN